MELRAESNEKVNPWLSDMKPLIGIANKIASQTKLYKSCDLAVKLADDSMLHSKKGIVSIDGAVDHVLSKKRLFRFELDLLSELRKLNSYEVICENPACNISAKRGCHVIQRSGVLSHVINASNKVGVLGPNQKIDDELKEVGWQDASTFKGFCAKCDGLLFKSFESFSTRPNLSDAVRACWRAACATKQRKAIALRARAQQLSSDDLYTELNKEPEASGYLLMISHFFKGEIDLYRDASVFERTISHATFSNLNSFTGIAFKLESPLLVSAGASGIGIDKDLNWQMPTLDWNKTPKPVMFSCMKFEHSSFLVFCWERCNNELTNTFKRFSFMEKRHYSNCLMKLLLSYCDFNFFSIDRWNNLNRYEKAVILDFASAQGTDFFEECPLLPDLGATFSSWLS